MPKARAQRARREREDGKEGAGRGRGDVRGDGESIDWNLTVGGRQLAVAGTCFTL